MRPIDPGHAYRLDQLDGDSCTGLVFVKREGEGYPGNVGHYAGTNLQEVFRACIDRVKHINQQVPHSANGGIIWALRYCIWMLELRAAERHRRITPEFAEEIETMPTCKLCGHIGCYGECE